MLFKKLLITMYTEKMFYRNFSDPGHKFINTKDMVFVLMKVRLLYNLLLQKLLYTEIFMILL